jgi:carbon-monoxide dehydrogenase medium subunit
MRIRNFEYHTPADLTEACRILAEHGGTAAVLAGGTDLLVHLKEETVHWNHLVSLRRVEEVRGIHFDAKNGLTIGAAVTHSLIARSEPVRLLYPGLAEAAFSIGAVQVRNRGTIGGNICSAVPSADLPPILLALESEFRLVGVNGERRIPAKQFFLGPRKTVLQADEILVSIHVPLPVENSGSCYLKFALRDAVALAVAGVASFLAMDARKCREARIALGAVAPTPVLAAEAAKSLGGAEINEAAARRAGAIARGECKPISDIRGSEAYRRDLVDVLTQRSLLAAAARARGDN